MGLPETTICLRFQSMGTRPFVLNFRRGSDLCFPTQAELGWGTHLSGKVRRSNGKGNCGSFAAFVR